MFYLQYSLWLGLYFFVWSFFKIRKLIFKILKYPFYPESFDFDQLPLFWKHLLVYFYSEKNFLSKLPLEKNNINKILHFRKFVNFRFYKYIYFKEFSEIKKKIIPLKFNNFKKQYKIFLKCSAKSVFLNYFFGESNFFLKFLFLKKYCLNKKYFLFFYNYFFKNLKIDFNKINLKQIYTDYLTLIMSCILKNSDKFFIIKIYESLGILVFHKILNIKEKSISINRNFYWEKHYFWLKYFINIKRIISNQLFNSYEKLWDNHLIRSKISKKLSGFSFKNFLKNHPVKYLEEFTNFFKNYWPSRLQNSSFTKFVDVNNNSLLFFLRKNKIFNKGRYSRNRQIYRTGVYMCLWINIIFVYFYIFSFYRFTFNFGFLWVGIGIFIISMVIGRSAKYRLYNFKNFFNELVLFFRWLGFFTHNTFIILINFFKKFLPNFFKNKVI